MAVWQGGSSEVIVPCKSDYPGPLRWYVKKNPYSAKVPLYNGFYLNPDAESYCTVKVDVPGESQLHLKNTADSAQTYICFEPGILAEASADVISIGSNLMCDDRSSEDLVNLTCTIEFHGNWAPAMVWKEHSSQGDKVLSIGVNTITLSNQRVTSTLTMPVQKGRRNYTCTTKFDINGKPNTTTATNVPHYIRDWASSVFSGSHEQMPAKSIVTVLMVVIAAASTFAINSYLTL